MSYEWNPGRFVSTDSRIFLALADAVSLREALHTGLPIRERLTEGWSAVLEHIPHEAWAPHVRRWLEAARDAGVHRDGLLATLADAGAAQPRAIGRMYVVAQHWARASGTDRRERGLVADRFLLGLDAAQGLVTPTSTTVHHAPETPL